LSDNIKFLVKANWNLIKRGWIFEAAVPYVGERPLEFFIPDKKDTYRGRKIPVSGTAVSLSTSFQNVKDEYQVVLGLKQRKVVIISSDELNSDSEHDDVIIAKIYSIYEDDKTEPWYEPTKAGTHPMFAYLPKTVTGRECFVDLSNTTTIHKNMLLDDKKDISDFMPVIEDKMEYCFQMGIYKQKQPVSNEDIG